MQIRAVLDGGNGLGMRLNFCYSLLSCDIAKSIVKQLANL